MALSHELIAEESGGEAQAPPSIRKFNFTKAAGAVIGAAVLLAGGYALGRRAGTSVRGKAFTMLDTSEDHEFKHMSKECVAELLKFEKAAEAEHKQHEKDGHDVECGEEQMACKITAAMGPYTHDASKCFPAHKCRTENIRKEIADSMNGDDMPEDMHASLKFFQCGADEPWTPEPDSEPEEEEEARLLLDEAEAIRLPVGGEGGDTEVEKEVEKEEEKEVEKEVAPEVEKVEDEEMLMKIKFTDDD